MAEMFDLHKNIHGVKVTQNVKEYIRFYKKLNNPMAGCDRHTNDPYIGLKDSQTIE